MSKQPKLKPCPFCGNKKVRVEAINPDYEEDGFAIYCNSCGATGPNACDSESFKIDKEEAEKAWNNRRMKCSS